MRFRNRILARAGAAVLLAAGAAAALAAPAYAATATDLELTVVGTKANGEAKAGWAKVTNKGENTPSKVTIAVDVSALDFSKVFVAPAIDRCVSEGDDQPEVWTCELAEDEIPGPGETVDLELILFTVQPGVAPYRAPVTYTISSPDDTNKENNSKTTDVVFTEESGVDLGVLVPDVKEAKTEPSASGPALRAGDTTVVWGEVFNWGDLVADGVKITVQLPANVTFAEVEPDCEYSADNRKATCTYKGVVVTPIRVAGDDRDVAVFYWPITVGAGVEAPVVLPEGSWNVEALGQSPVSELRARNAGALPSNVEMVSAEEAGVNEIDASDNVDGFAVIVAGDGSGGGGGLPVTGVQAGVLGGVGLAVVVAGAVLFLVARRRRVVLVTPDDEKPTS